MNYIRVDESNQTEFSSVLPGIYSDGMGVALAAYEDDGTLCGAVSVSFDGTQYDVDWLYVEPEKRRTGVGTGLIKEIRRMVASIGICPIRALFDSSEESGLYDFFSSISSPDLIVDVDYSHVRYIVTAEDFYKSKAMKERVILPYAPKYFWDMDEELREDALEMAADHLTITDYDSFEDSCEKNLCLGVEKDGKIKAMLLVQNDSAGDLLLTYLYAKSQKALMAMLKAEVRALRRKYKKRTLYFDAVTEESERLAKKIFPTALARYIYEAEF